MKASWGPRGLVWVACGLLGGLGVGCGEPSADEPAPSEHLATESPLERARSLAEAEPRFAAALAAGASHWSAFGDEGARTVGRDAIRAELSARGRLEIRPRRAAASRVIVRFEDARDVTPTLVEGTVVFAGVRPQTDAIVSTQGGEVEVFYLLAGPEASTRFAWSIETHGGLVPREESDGGVALVDVSGRAVTRITAPGAIDAAGVAHAITTSLDGGQIHFALRSESAIAYPLLIDPIIYDVEWEQPNPIDTPGGRETPLVYDAGRNEVVLFGGFDGSGVRADTWVWDGTNWVDRSPTESPPARALHAMAYDEARERVVLFGGRTEEDFFSDTWVWNGVTWQDVTPVDPLDAPVARAWHAMAYRSSTPIIDDGRVILFGGEDAGGGLLDDTWQWNGMAWNRRSPTTRPPARRSHAAAYHVVEDFVVVFGGVGSDDTLRSDAWGWNGTVWTLLDDGSGPSARAEHAMTYDSLRERIIVYGGQTGGAGATETWELDGDGWHLRTPGSSPGERSGHGLAYDVARERTVLFGGNPGGGSGPIDETWELVAEVGLGSSCDAPADCGSGFCVDGVCCDSACGGGVEDCQACSIAAGGTTDGSCGPLAEAVAPTITCRESAGSCDVAETCSPSLMECPPDALHPTTHTCRASVSECDAPETCDGVSVGCPPDAAVEPGSQCGEEPSGACDAWDECVGTVGAEASCEPRFEPSTTVCREASGACELAAFCPGDSTVCPSNELRDADEVCRAALPTGCDVAEVCDGVSAACPEDAALPPGTACGGDPSGLCDAQNVCEGTTGATAFCADQFAPGTTPCGPDPDPCELRATCTGDSTTCPPNPVRTEGYECRPAVDGGCDVAEVCDGVTGSCPPNGYASSTVVCRASVGECDVEETCPGDGPTCPSDAAEPPGTACGGDPSGPCDAQNVCDGTTGASAVCAERFEPETTECGPDPDACELRATCTGSTPTCPPNPIRTEGHVCRPAAGDCDIAEACDGVAPSCPDDEYEPSTVVCRGSEGACDVEETCPGDGSDCPPDGFAPSTEVCRASIGECDVEETCPGDGASCPADAAEAPGTACGGDPSGPCDAQNVCEGTTGASAVCADRFEPETTECGPDPDACELRATCTGASTGCPPNPIRTDGHVCRPAAGFCDVAEACDGVSPSCPADGFEPSSVICRPSAGDCDVPEACPGDAPTCPEDTFATGTPCRDASCEAGSQTASATCDGSGVDCPAPIVEACAPFICGDTACLSSCAADSSCADGNFCDETSTCAPLLETGEACTRDGACESEQCVDGFCCDTSCTGQCEACDAAGLEGTCSPITGAPREPRPACTTDGTICGGECGGVDREACVFPGGETLCRDPSCTDDVAVLAASCAGAGSCPAEELQACAPFVCGDTECDGDCDVDGDCADDAFCSAGVCTAKRAQGASCGRDAQCATDHCVDGFCCDLACDGQCEACDEEDSLGECVPIEGTPRGGRAACATDGSVCGGECDGVDRAGCAYRGDDTFCADETCEAGVATELGRCDGAGDCMEGSAIDCTPYACGETLCLSACAGEDDCAEGFFCDFGACAPIPTEPDAGPSDPDAGPTDSDAGRVDAGPPPDAGASDAAMPELDGGPTPMPDEGCSCRAGSGQAPSAPTWLIFVLGAALCLRRLRRRGRGLAFGRPRG